MNIDGEKADFINSEIFIQETEMISDTWMGVAKRELHNQLIAKCNEYENKLVAENNPAYVFHQYNSVAPYYAGDYFCLIASVSFFKVKHNETKAEKAPEN